jgi:salicylate biosynthesis isochorismate synthase/menaquinone-specific isochorismate synthase
LIEASSALASLEALLERGGESRRLASVTVPVEVPDPCAAVFASRLAADRWFCWEQPDRDGFALAGLGSVHEIVSRGEGRFRDAVEEGELLARGRLADEPREMPAGAGPVWVGGFAFDPDSGRDPQWSSFPPALLVMPEISLRRSADETLLTVCAVSGPGVEPAGTAAWLEARVASLGSSPLPLVDPHPTGEVRIASALAPEAFERSVERAVARVHSRELQKVVLAREVVVGAPRAHDAAAIFGALRELFPSCFCFCCGSPEGAFVGASPELLVRRSGASAATVALAGSTRRSADPAVDDHLGQQLLLSAKDREEHAIVARRIERELRRHAVWVEAEPQPSLIRVANIQHLATPIHAQLSEPRSAVELAGLLHPTPAVGGEPRAEALAAIAELEGMDRGWYAGPVGWMDAAEDGEFCVALRSALLRDRTAHLYAGGGIVADSDPAAELAETEVKLEALLPLLAG